MNVPNGPMERFHRKYIATKAYKENSSYLDQNVNGGQMSNIDRDKKGELFYAISCSSETTQVLDIEELRPILMPNTLQYICNDVRFRESNDAVLRKGFFERGDKKVKEKDMFVNVINVLRSFSISKDRKASL